MCSGCFSFSGSGKAPGLSEQWMALSSDEPHVTVNRQKCLKATWTHILLSPLPGPSQRTWFLGGLRASPPLRKPRGASSAPHTHVPEQIRETGLLEAGLSGSSAPRGHIGLPGAVSVGASALRGVVCPFVPTMRPPPGCPVTHPHPHAAHSTALVPGSPGTHPDAQQFSLISFRLWFGKPLVGTAHGMAPHIPSTNRKAALWTK